MHFSQITHNSTAPNSTTAPNDWTAEGAEPDFVSYWYFMASMATWFTTPFLFMLFQSRLLGGKASFGLKGLKQACHPVVFYPIKKLVDYVVSVLWVYAAVPLLDICMGVNSLFCHETYKTGGHKGQKVYSEIHAFVPAMKLPEQLGEALPQFVIALVFFSKNAHWLSPWEMTLGCVTMTLSCGSIVLGVVNGIKAMIEYGK